MEAGTTVQIRMPEMGESVTEGTILEWLKQVGDEVEADEGIVEVSTDKVDTEVPAPAGGVLTKILVEPDDVVATGTVVARIAVGATSSASAEQEAKTAEVGQEPKPAAATGNGAENATPVAAHMAAANGVDISSLSGTGPRGRVTKDDIEN